jgi:hypothetical protein
VLTLALETNQCIGELTELQQRTTELPMAVQFIRTAIYEFESKVPGLIHLGRSAAPVPIGVHVVALIGLQLGSSYHRYRHIATSVAGSSWPQISSISRGPNRPDETFLKTLERETRFFDGRSYNSAGATPTKVSKDVIETWLNPFLVLPKSVGQPIL